MLPGIKNSTTALNDAEQSIYALLDSADLDHHAKAEILDQETLSFIHKFPMHAGSICQILIALYKANILTNDNRKNLFDRYSSLTQRLSQQIYTDEFGQLKCDRDELSFSQGEINSLTYGLSEICLLLQDSNLLTQERYEKMFHSTTQLGYLSPILKNLKRFELLLPAIVDRLLKTLGHVVMKDFDQVIPVLDSIGVLNEPNISKLLNLFEEAQRYNPYTYYISTDYTSSSASRETDWSIYCNMISLPNLMSLLNQHALLTPEVFNFILENAKFPLYNGASILANEELLNEDTFGFLMILPQHAEHIGEGISTLSHANLLDTEGVNIKKCIEKIEYLTQISDAFHILQSADLLDQIYFDLILNCASNADAIAKVLVCLNKAKILSANNQQLVVNFAQNATEIATFCEKFLCSSTLTQVAFETIMANIEYLSIMQKFRSFYEHSYMSLDRFKYYLEKAKEYLATPQEEPLESSEFGDGIIEDIYDYDDAEDYGYANETEDLTIWSAVEKDSIDEASLLLSKGARINVIRPCPGGEGEGPNAEETPLVKAVAKKHFALAKYLVENGAYINLVEDNPIIYAAGSNFDMLQYLVEHGADVNAIFHSYVNINWEPLTLDYDAINNAASSGDVARVEYLIAHGADINRELTNIDDITLSRRRSTALVSAILSKNVTIKMVECLLNHGADYNSRGEALCAAVKNKKLEIVKYLLEQGADANFENGIVFSLALKDKDPAILALLKPYDNKGYLQKTNPEYKTRSFMALPETATLESEQTTASTPAEAQAKQDTLEDTADTRIASSELTQLSLFFQKNLSTSPTVASSTANQEPFCDKSRSEQTIAPTEKDTTTTNAASEKLEHLGILP